MTTPLQDSYAGWGMRLGVIASLEREAHDQCASSERRDEARAKLIQETVAYLEWLTSSTQKCLDGSKSSSGLSQSSESNFPASFAPGGIAGPDRNYIHSQLIFQRSRVAAFRESRNPLFSIALQRPLGSPRYLLRAQKKLPELQTCRFDERIGITSARQLHEDPMYLQASSPEYRQHLRYHCNGNYTDRDGPTDWISCSSEVNWMADMIPRYRWDKGGYHIAFIDTAILETQLIPFAASSRLAEEAGLERWRAHHRRDNPFPENVIKFTTDTHWLIYGWVPAESITWVTIDDFQLAVRNLRSSRQYLTAEALLAGLQHLRPVVNKNVPAAMSLEAMLGAMSLGSEPAASAVTETAAAVSVTVKSATVDSSTQCDPTLARPGVVYKDAGVQTDASSAFAFQGDALADGALSSDKATPTAPELVNDSSDELPALADPAGPSTPAHKKPLVSDTIELTPGTESPATPMPASRSPLVAIVSSPCDDAPAHRKSFASASYFDDRSVAKVLDFTKIESRSEVRMAGPKSVTQ